MVTVIMPRNLFIFAMRTQLCDVSVIHFVAVINIRPCFMLFNVPLQPSLPRTPPAHYIARADPLDLSRNLVCGI